ncbi:unnamed protein product [Brassica rapa subsp. narinosa]
MVNASEVTKVKTLTIRETFAFLKQEPAQVINVCIHVPYYDKVTWFSIDRITISFFVFFFVPSSNFLCVSLGSSC